MILAKLNRNLKFNLIKKLWIWEIFPAEDKLLNSEKEKDELPSASYVSPSAKSAILKYAIVKSDTNRPEGIPPSV